MRKWSKKLGFVAGGLIGLGELIAPVHAQFPGAPGPMPPSGGGVFAGEPQPPVPPDFPNAGSPGSAGDRATAFSVRDEGMPNAFTELDSPYPRQRYSVLFRAEYLNWKISDGNLSRELVTTTTATPDLFVNNGNLGSATTQVLLGQGSYGYGDLNGGRATIGFSPYYLPPIEVTGFAFNRNRTLLTAFSDGSAGSRLIARPFQTADITGQLNFPTDDVSFVAVPGVLAGGIDVTTRLSFWGFESNFLVSLGESDVLQVYFIGGYRHADLNEQLDIRTSSSPLPGTLLNFAADPNGLGVGTTVNVQDRFRARSQFDGGQFGFRSIFSYSRLHLWLDTKLAMGNTTDNVDIAGTSAANLGRNTGTLAGGLLSGASNIGRLSSHDFSIIPEANLNLGLQLTPNIRVFGGYNAMYWNRIARAGDQVNTLVDTRQVPTDTNFIANFQGIAPTNTPIHQTNLFVHGFSFGLEVGF